MKFMVTVSSGPITLEFCDTLEVTKLSFGKLCEIDRRNTISIRSTNDSACHYCDKPQS